MKEPTVTITIEPVTMTLIKCPRKIALFWGAVAPPNLGQNTNVGGVLDLEALRFRQEMGEKIEFEISKCKSNKNEKSFHCCIC